MILLLAAALGTALQASPGTQSRLDDTIARLNAASAKFTNATASFQKDLYTALVKDHTIQDGSIYFIHEKSGHAQMGSILTGNAPSTVEYKNGSIRLWNRAAINCVSTYAASQSLADSYLTLGFGGSGTDLQKAWTIDDQGPDTVAGTPVERLNLVPKEQGVKNNFTHIMLWLDLARGVSLKQVFYTPSGDTTTAVYSNVEVNVKKIDMKPYAISGKPCDK